VGAVVVVLRSDGTLPAADKLHVEVRSLDGTQTYRDQDYSVPPYLPSTLSLVSDGKATDSALLEVTVWSGATPLDVRQAQVEEIPTSTVVEFDVTFSARCTPHVVLTDGVASSDCGALASCSPETGQCVDDRVFGSLLPLYGLDAGAAGDAIGGARPDAADAGSGDVEGGDAIADGRSCDSGTVRCTRDHMTVQSCDSTRTWADEAQCALGVEHCVNGRCVAVPPSCLNAPPGAGADCIVDSKTTGDCCAMDPVIGGTYVRSFDGTVYTDASSPARVSSFLLDDYEVTVGRFRQFVDTTVAMGGWYPDAGAGIHGHVNGGAGLAGTAGGGTPFETGWDPNWDNYVQNQMLNCSNDYATWVEVPDATEGRPINCVNWYEAYAFCIWDGGFLPSESEWNYAAAGGDAQLEYPWGFEDPGTNADLAIYGCRFGAAAGTPICSNLLNIAPVGYAHDGRGRFGQWDLAGNVAEWTLDVNVPYVTPCDDCAALGGGSQRVERGGSFDGDPSALRAGARPDPSVPHYAAFPFQSVGFRCARQP
jgi:formylglycine-generating enzyme required for sulfatase activity